MPKEYIEREEVREAFRMEFDNEYADDITDRLSTADVQEVRHGKWVYTSRSLEWADCKCSECGYTDIFASDIECFYNYCPHCGAKMDKE